MSTDYNLDIIEGEGNTSVNFANNTDSWVEVILELDGWEIREGKMFSHAQRGYCYPPKYQKEVSKTKDGSKLPFNPQGGVLRAHVWRGRGEYKHSLDIPTFLRKKLKQKARFKRTDRNPVEVLEVNYGVGFKPSFIRKSISV